MSISSNARGVVVIKERLIRYTTRRYPHSLCSGRALGRVSFVLWYNSTMRYIIPFLAFVLMVICLLVMMLLLLQINPVTHTSYLPVREAILPYYKEASLFFGNWN